MKPPKLEPCVFCGDMPRHTHEQRNDGTIGNQIQCTQCAATIESVDRTRSAAVRRWNAAMKRARGRK